jgi:hypothetical protein
VTWGATCAGTVVAGIHGPEYAMRGARLHAILVPLLLLAGAPRTHAHSLENLFDQVLQFEGELERSPRFRRGLESVIVTFQLNAVRTADFVATATTPGFAYSYDPETGVFKRTETARGPVYVEPADTVGRGGFDVSFAYQYAKFTELDGQSLENAFDSELHQVRGTDVLDIQTRKFDFQAQVFALSGTYGLTDHWDVNLLIPVFSTTLKLNGTSVLLVPGANPFSNTFVENDTKLGVGDLLLRTKYRLADRLGLQLATELTLRVPSGNADNFQGLGDVTLTPLFIAQRAFGPHVAQANLGVELNAGAVGQSRVRYAIGATFRLLTHVSFLAHLIGNSGFVDDHFEEGDVRGVVPRTDIVDASAGFEISITQKIVAYVGTLVPLTDDGLRPDVVPTGWIGARF